MRSARWLAVVLVGVLPRAASAQETRPVAELIAVLTDADRGEGSKLRAMSDLQQHGAAAKAAIPHLRRHVFEDRRSEFQQQALHALKAIGADAVPVFADVLRDTRFFPAQGDIGFGTRTGRLAIDLVRQMGPVAKATGPALATLVAQPHLPPPAGARLNLRYDLDAIKAIIAVEATAADVVPALIAAVDQFRLLDTRRLTDSEDWQQVTDCADREKPICAACQALAAYGPAATAAVPALGRVVATQNIQFFRAPVSKAAAALGAIGAAAEPALPALRAALRSVEARSYTEEAIEKAITAIKAASRKP